MRHCFERTRAEGLRRFRRGGSLLAERKHLGCLLDACRAGILEREESIFDNDATAESVGSRSV